MHFGSQLCLPETFGESWGTVPVHVSCSSGALVHYSGKRLADRHNLVAFLRFRGSAGLAAESVFNYGPEVSHLYFVWGSDPMKHKYGHFDAVMSGLPQGPRPLT